MESIRRKFIGDRLLKNRIKEFLEKELRRAWISDINIQKSPVETRITIKVLDPRRILSKREGGIKYLQELLKKEFGIENPVIKVLAVKEPWLDPVIVARRIARGLEMGRRVRALLYRSLDRIMEAGAIGAEITIKGKLGAKGAKARGIKARKGFVPKAGYPTAHVRKCHYSALTKSGIIGITVLIAPPGIPLPDKEIEKPAESEQVQPSS